MFYCLTFFEGRLSQFVSCSQKHGYLSSVQNFLVKLKASAYTDWSWSSAFSHANLIDINYPSIFLNSKYTSASSSWRQVTNDSIGCSSYFTLNMICSICYYLFYSYHSPDFSRLSKNFHLTIDRFIIYNFNSLLLHSSKICFQSVFTMCSYCPLG